MSKGISAASDGSIWNPQPDSDTRLIQLAISRSREYAADRDGARISGAPLALANALRKMESVARRRPLSANPSTTHMFIVNPLKRNFVSSLFSTHPAIQKRIARLEALAGRR